METPPPPRPAWLTFDCYGTLIQWDEGLLAAVGRVLARRGGAAAVPAPELIAAYDRHEHALEAARPHRPFRAVAGEALRLALAERGLDCDDADAATLTGAISAMPPFPEVPATLAALRAAGFRLCIVSNTDDAVIAGNVAQLGPPGLVERVVTAEQAGAYKPGRAIFAHAHRAIGVPPQGPFDAVCHVCASPHLDLAAAREIGFRAVWVDRGTGRAAPPGYAPAAVVPRLDAVLPLFAAWGWMAGPPN